MYVSQQTIRSLLDPQDQKSGTAGELTDTQLETSIKRATSEVDARLRLRYSVPFADPVPTLVHDICADLAAYDATLVYYGSVDISVDDPVVLRYTRSMKLLADLAAGRADLGISVASTGSSDEDLSLFNQWDRPAFTRFDIEPRPGSFGLSPAGDYGY